MPTSKMIRQQNQDGNRTYPKLGLGNLLGKGALLILAIGLATRIVTSVIQIQFGLGNFSLLIPLPAWNDFYTVYAGWLQSVSQGMIPYRDFLSYEYTPLFLYTLYPFYVIGGAHAAAIPVVISDAATSPLVYLISKRMTSQRVAFTAGIAYALCPLAIFYEGYLWLSSQPMAFFLLLAICFMLLEKPNASFAAYGVSVMFNQEAAFVLPVFLVWGVMKYGTRVWKGVCLFAAIVLAVSSPFLLLSPGHYLQDVTFGLLGSLSHPAYLTSTGSPVSFVGPPSLQIPQTHCPATLPTAAASFSCVEYPNPILTMLLPVLAWLSDELVIPFLVLAGIAVFLSRQTNRVGLVLSYSLVCVLFVFYFIFHASVAYYFVPFYAVLFSLVRTRLGLAVPLLTSTASLMLSTGSFSFMMALGSLLLVVGLQEGGPGPEARHRDISGADGRDSSVGMLRP